MTLQLTRAGFAFPGTATNFKTGTWRVQKPVHVHHAAPCHHACPAGEDAQAYIAHLQAGNTRAAWETLVAVNPMPAITGRVCPHPCESACNRQFMDESIAIHAIERFLGDEAIAKNWAYPVEAPPVDAPEIAIIGAGPAGISTAYHLIKLGFRATIFDDNSEAGGTLRTALPPYRLPRETLDAELQRILSLEGITFKPQTRVGRDVRLDELKNQFAAVFLGIGAQKSQEWSIDGATPSDLHSGLDLIKAWISIGSVPTPQSVAIVGAGNTAVDMARIMKRAGVAQVHLISHKPIPKAGIPASEAMPAIPREVEEALEEGVNIHEYRGIRRLILRGEKVVGIELVHMKKLPQASGRLKRIAFAGTETILNVDMVIPAVGQVLDSTGFESILNGQNSFKVNHWGQLEKHLSLFAGGDAIYHSHGTVTGAIGDGRRAALGIVASLNNQTLSSPNHIDPIPYKSLNLHYYEPNAPRVLEPTLPVPERHGDAEITGTLNIQHIQREAMRCFSCGNCLACDNCWTFCPDSAILKTAELASDGSHYVFDYDYCKGCGLCAKECPCGFIQMLEDW